MRPSPPTSTAVWVVCVTVQGAPETAEATPTSTNAGCPMPALAVVCRIKNVLGLMEQHPSVGALGLKGFVYAVREGMLNGGNHFRVRA